MLIEISVDPIAVLVFVLTAIGWSMNQILRSFRWLGRIFSGRTMFLVFGIAFALSTALEIYSLGIPYPIQQLSALFQWSAVVQFAAALLMCIFAFVATIVDALHKRGRRPKIVWGHPFDSDGHY